MAWYPLNAAGLVYSHDSGGTTILGTCSAYRGRDTWITAAHCVPEGVEAMVRPAVGPSEGERAYTTAATVLRHPSADLAVLRLEPSSPGEHDALAYKGTAQRLIDGGDFIGMGFPVEGVQTPVARMFKGHFMRYFRYDAPSGSYSYLAAEMSIPAPPGLSGGALALPSEPEQLAAVVTTNVDSEVVLDRTEQVERDGAMYREAIVRQVSYGLAVLLQGPAAEWLDEMSAPRRA
jgi:hypothetical protein